MSSHTDSSHADSATTDSATIVEEPVAGLRPLRKDAARNRALLIQAAREIFAERGLEASLDDIARHAGVGVGTAYRHFGNKYELAKAIFEQAIDAIVELAESVVELDDPWQGIATFLEGAAEAQSADRGLRDVMMGIHDEDNLERITDRIGALLGRLVGRAKDAGVIRADAEASDIAVLVMMLCTVADLSGGSNPDLWRRYLPMLLDGLRPGPDLPVPPIDETVLRREMATYKQRLARSVPRD